MKKRKIITGLILTLAVTTAALSGCGESEQPAVPTTEPVSQETLPSATEPTTTEPTTEAPTEEATGGEAAVDTNRWHADLDSHWKLTPEGAQSEQAPHAMEYDFCTVCNAEIMKYSDGTATVTLCDESWNVIFCRTYAADGSSSAVTTEYTYDSNGIPTAYREYTDDILSAEGTRDEEGNDVSRTEYREGMVSEYEYGLVGEEVFEEIKATGVTITLEDGTRQFRRFSYDEFADLMGESLYDDQDALLEERIYHYEDNACTGYTLTEYHADGTTTVTEHEIDIP